MRIEKTKVKETKKQFNKGITLIALVITILNGLLKIVKII